MVSLGLLGLLMRKGNNLGTVQNLTTVLRLVCGLGDLGSVLVELL